MNFKKQPRKPTVKDKMVKVHITGVIEMADLPGNQTMLFSEVVNVPASFTTETLHQEVKKKYDYINIHLNDVAILLILD